VKVVGGCEISNFRIQSLVLFYSKIWSYSCSNRCSAKQSRPEHRRTATSRTPRAPPSSASAPEAAPPEAARRPRPCSFPMRRAPRPGNPPDRAHAMDHAVPAGARHGPPVRRQHAAVSAPVEVAVLRRHLRRHGCVTGSLAYKTQALLSPPPAAIAPPPRHPRRLHRAAPSPLPTVKQARTSLP
jgi:hypothetical protein